MNPRFVVGLWLASILSASATAPVITAPPFPQTVFIGDPATFHVEATGTEPMGYQWLRNGTPLAGAASNTLTFATSAGDDGVKFAVRVANNSGAVTSAPVVLTIDFGTPGPSRTNRWVDITAAWRYNVGKTNPPSGWTAPDYADQAWAQGGGLLYVEESALPAPKTTALPLTAGSLPRTCYFRTRFTNDLANAYSTTLIAHAVIDDGLVLHLNGRESLRLGMAEEPVSYDTLSARSVGNAAWEGPLELPPGNLAPGENVLAAEVHQVNDTSTDIVMGLTLDAVWQPRLRDSNAPVVLELQPAAGATVSALRRIEVRFDERVNGVNAADLLVNGQPATNLTVVAPDDYIFFFPPPPSGPVAVTWAPNHGITDRSVNANAFAGAGFGYLVGAVSTASRLAFHQVRQSTDAAPGNTAAKAVDGSTSTFSLTRDAVGGYWEGELARTYPLERIEVVNRAAPDDPELQGLALRLFDLDDQVVFETTLANPGSGGVAVIPLPAGTAARSVRVGLRDDQTNGAGNRRVGLAEIRVFGTPDTPYLPPPPTGVNGTNLAKVWQSSEYGGFPAGNAIDGDTQNFTHTADLPDSYWMADLGRGFRIDRVEIVNRDSCCDNRLQGLVLRIFDAGSNSLHSAVLTNPGLGGTWSYTPPAGTAGRWLRVGLEDGKTNAGGNYYVTLAEARVFSGTTNVLTSSPVQPVQVTNNLASFKPSFMLRLDDSVPPAGRANDDNFSTETKTTMRTVDGYWEVDLGATRALYSVRAIAASGISFRLTNAIVRLYDAAHESVFARKLSGTPDTFDMDLNGPVFARYVRVGLEDKQRTDPAGGIEFYVGFREVEVFGRPTNEVGILSFSTPTPKLPPGGKATLFWNVEDVRRAEIHPAIGSVGAHTAVGGAGQITLTPTNSTEYILVASNTAGLFIQALGVEIGSSPLPVRISELVAENKYSLKDGYGEASDWIELRNTGNAAVDLTGWGLSDDSRQPMKWVFPATNIQAHSALIVFASGRNTALDPSGGLHCNFRLNKNGGALLLTAKDGVTLLDSLAAYPELDADLAYGRDLEDRWTFLEPTPDRPNAATAYLGWLKPLDWSHARGFYEIGFTLTLTNQNSGATVFYSLGGAEPALPYSQGLQITGTTTVRAQVVRPGYKPARIQTKTFLFVNDVITSKVMNTAITQNPAYAPRMRPGLLALPSISICVPGQPEYEEKEGSLEVLWPGGGEPVQVNCGISRFGNAWTKFDKRSFRMKCRARYGDDKLRVPLFNGFDRGVLAKTAFDELDLRSGSQDMVERGFYMAGRFVEDSMLDMGSLNPHGRFVHVYINGVYWGQYDCRELLVDHFLADYLGGVAGEYVVVRGNDNVSDDFVLGTPDPPHIQPWETTRSLRRSYASVGAWLDVNHLVDFMLLWSYGDCESEFRCCGPVQPGSGFKFWIADADGFLRTSALGLNRTDRLGPGGLFGGLVGENSPDFKTLLADRIYRHFFNDGALTPAANDKRLADRMREIQDSLLAECARWGYRTPANWESSARTIRSNLFPTRTTQLLGYLRSRGLYPSVNPPAFDQYGGLVAPGFRPVLSTASGTIYFTPDGSDPRSPGGGISPLARVWSPDAVTVTNDFTLAARVRTSTGAWSALAQPRFLLASRRPPAPRDLLITEIHYNPSGEDDCEFIEIHNAGTNILDLSGVTLANAVRFVFPAGFGLAPGAFAVMVRDAASFAERYQFPSSPWYYPELTVAGQWAGSLDNSGETVSLVDSKGVELHSVAYRVGGNWPERADAKGSSLELRTPPPGSGSDEEAKAFLADGRSWGSSALYHGSPGRFDTDVKSVRISEVLSHTDPDLDWIELENPDGEPADLTGCALTDDMDTPAAWTFAAQTIVQPGARLLLPASGLGFTFKGSGDQVFLLQLAGTNVIRFLDSVDFPAAERGESFGLFQRSDGEFDFTELRAVTPGAKNSLPRVGPVVMSEIMSTPAPGMAEFVELTSITNRPVPLFDPQRPTNVWRLEGVGAYAFPTGVVVEACSSIIICATNPAAFREQYGVAPGVPVLGPWSGALDDDGETLRLMKPGTPELDGSVPYYRVDHVTYQTSTPWPAVAAGRSRERLPLQAYGNEPGVWVASPQNGTPGIAATNRPPIIHVDGELTVTELTPARLLVSAADPDAPWQAVAVWPTRLPPSSAFDELSGVFSWTPSADQGPGVYQMEFTATDDPVCGTQTAGLTVSMTVEEPSQASIRAWAQSGALWLSFPAVEGTAYSIEFRDDLGIGNWQTLEPPLVATTNLVTFSTPILENERSRFYRVRLLPSR
jgi:hypothetical protein